MPVAHVAAVTSPLPDQSVFDAVSRLKSCLARALAGGEDPSVSPEALGHLDTLVREYRGGEREKLDAFVEAMRNPDAFSGLSRAVVLARGQRFLWTLIAALEDEAEQVPKKSARRGAKHAAVVTSPGTPFDPALLTFPGIGPKTASRLASRGIASPLDLLFFLPRRYDDRRRVIPISELKEGARAVTEGTVKQVRVFGRPWKQMMELVLEDDGAEICGMWFSNRRPQRERFVPGARIYLGGLVTRYKNRLQIAHPTVASPDDPGDAFGRIVPIYPEVPAVAGRTVEKAIRAAAARADTWIDDPIPTEILARRALLPLAEALRAVHLPPSDTDDAALDAWVAGESPAHRRLIYDELFFVRLALMLRKERHRAAPAPAAPAAADAARSLGEAVGFTPTAAQRRVVREIGADLARGTPMQRLLQGDVGSGKTFVAAAAILQAVGAGYQAALMAPTELLAEQHMRTLYPLFKQLGIRAVLHMGSARAAVRKKNLDALASRRAQVAVGTHALLQERVTIPDLALAIVDEQHRFGVSQRLGLVGKGPSGTTPHLLVMTATPIPRTLALTVHGDLDVSVLDELPPGRHPVETVVHPVRDRERALDAAALAMARDEQAFVVCPVIEESETLDLKAAETVYEELRGRFERYGVGLLHGRMKPEEKDAVMDDFVCGAIRMLVTTTVIEVGVDVPRATVMVVDGADRFGLAQLHQLRGRVGRSELKASCHLVADPKTDEAWERLNTLVRTCNGFEVAEADLSIRGPGELYGRRQAGLPGFRYGNLLRDVSILEQAGADAAALLAADPSLSGPVFTKLKDALARRMASDGAPVGEEAG